MGGVIGLQFLQPRAGVSRSFAPISQSLTICKWFRARTLMYSPKTAGISTDAEVGGVGFAWFRGLGARTYVCKLARSEVANQMRPP
jgi:hypothetical protein